jgi:molybdopterin-guanine dinucleotide biosynthesis protein A
LADRTARLLSQAAAPVVEVGPGHSSLPTTREDPAGRGPLAALAAGAAWLEAAGAEGAFLVVAVDLPSISAELLHWLADRPGTGTVVPRVDGVAQPLCARYASGTGAVAARLVTAGERSMRALLEASAPEYTDEDAWSAVASRASFADVDTPDDARRSGLEMPGGSLAPDA